MSDAKGKTPVVTRPRPSAEADADDAGDAFEDVGFLEDSNALLDKIKTTAENVTTCQVRVRSKFHTPGIGIGIGDRRRACQARRCNRVLL